MMISVELAAWRPMESAPRDGLRGSRIRLRYGAAVHIGQWDEDDQSWHVEHYCPPGCDPPLQPTEPPDGWLPLISNADFEASP